MKVSMALKPLVFAMAAAMAIAAQANQSGGRHDNRDPLLDRNAGDATAYAGRDQYIGNAQATNVGTENSATIEDSLESSGNIGANVAAGDMNQQANNVAIATADEQFVFGSAEADSTIEQRSDASARNLGGANTSSMDGSGNGASGNIGVNAASGSFNQQQNALAIATARGWDAEATATGDQELSGLVDNQAGSVTVETTFSVTKDADKSYSSEYASDSSHSWDASHQRSSSESATASASLSSTYDSTASSDRTYSSTLDVVVDASQSSSSSGESNKNLAIEASADIDLEIDVERSRGELDVDVEGTADIEVNVDKSWSRSQESEAAFDLAKTVDKTSSSTADDSVAVDRTFDAEFSRTHESSSEASAEKNESHAANTSFEEVASSSLAATVTHTKSYTFDNPVTNAATLSGSLNDASGNMGVNIASGSGNQQLNTLAVAVGCNACNN